MTHTLTAAELSTSDRFDQALGGQLAGAGRHDPEPASQSQPAPGSPTGNPEVDLSNELVSHFGLAEDPRILKHRIAGNRLDWASVLAEHWSGGERQVLRLAAAVYGAKSEASLRDAFSFSNPDDFDTVQAVLKRAQLAGLFG